MFKKLTINNWRQFENIEIDFHKQLTILTGANGAGKTSILNILNNHFGWQSSFISTPIRDQKSGVLKYLTGVKRIFKLFDFFKEVHPSEQHKIGEIIYSNNASSTLVVPDIAGTNYQIQRQNHQEIKGLHIPSHRQIYSYQQVQSIPTQAKNREDIYNNYWNSLNNAYFSSYQNQRPNFIIKETLISLATFGYGNEVVVSNAESKKIFEEFQEILKIVLPKKIGFKKISIQMPEVVLETESGVFSLDSVSGGIASIIDLSWQIYMYPYGEGGFVVTIDEPENHLHPELQKTLLPNLMQAFPNVQFIVATHNPFIISSTPNSHVYVMNYNDEHQVFSTYLDMINKAGSSNDILREVLGIESTIPIWVEEKLDKIINKYAAQELSSENINRMRNEMEEIGFDKLIPSSIARIIDEGEKK